MANTNAPYGIKPHQFHGNTLGTRGGTTGSNVTIATYDPLFASSGLLYVATTTQAIFGIAAEPITGSAATQQDVLYWPAAKDVVFKTQSTPTNDITQANVGVSYDLGGSQGSIGIDVSGTTNPVLKVVGFVDGTEVGTYAELEVMIERSQFTGQD